MQLIYRGVAYQSSTISIALPPSALIGKYRGQAINITSPIQKLFPSPVILKYRGVVYPRQATNEGTLDRAIAI